VRGERFARHAQHLARRPRHAGGGHRQHQERRDDVQHAGQQRGVVGGDRRHLAEQRRHHRQLGRQLALVQHAQVRGRCHHFARQHADVPAAPRRQALGEVVDQAAELVARRQAAGHQPLQLLQADQPPVRLGQHGLVEAAAAAEVVVDRRQVDARGLGNRLARRFGIAQRGEAQARAFEDAGARAFAVGARWSLGRGLGLDHEDDGPAAKSAAAVGHHTLV